MFGQESRIQLAVLQEKFKSHEQIMDKVDTAIETLSETNQNICKMLTIHEEKINVQAKVDDEITKKVDGIELKIDSLYKFRWQAGGVLAVIIALVGIINAFGPSMLTENIESTTIERVK